MTACLYQRSCMTSYLPRRPQDDRLPAGVLAYERRAAVSSGAGEAGSDERQVWANFGAEPVELPNDWTVEVATSPHRDRTLGGEQAVILRPPG